MTPIDHVLVATDFGAASTRALEVGAEIATRFGSRVTVLHAIEDRSFASPCSVPPEIRQSAAFRLEETVRHIRKHVPAADGILREGFAWHEITQVAREVGADLVVLGSHGQGEGHRFLIGSVAEKVARVSAIPVLTVHAWRFENRTHAGRELAELVLRSDEAISTVIALSRGSAMVGAVVAEAFGASLHVLLTKAVAYDGHVVGAICEDGSLHLDESGGAVSGDDRKSASAGRAQSELVEEARRLRTTAWRRAAFPGTTLVVSDAILTSAPTLAAARALRRMGARRIVAAAPVAAVAARKMVDSTLDGSLVVQVVEDGVPLARLYRDLADPNDRAVIERLAVAAEWAEEVEKRP